MTTKEIREFEVACDFVDDAGRAILDRAYHLAAALLEQAAMWSPSEEGKRALRERASEAVAMAADEVSRSA